MKPTRLSEPIVSVMFERDNSTKGPSLTVGSIDRPGPPHVSQLFLRSNLCVKSGFFLFDLLAQTLKRPNLLDEVSVNSFQIR